MSTATRAVVIGGSVAGLLAAAALSGIYDEIVVLERDRLTGGGEFRSGVPQARHPHALLLRGAQSVERLLPGLRARMEADGAPIFDMGEHMVMSVRGKALPPRSTGLFMQNFSRNFFEEHLRARVRTLPGVTVRDGVRATGLEAVDGPSQIAGVHVTDSDGRSDFIPADLTVDAGGRNSASARWLGELGYQVPPDDVVDPKVGYTTLWLASGSPLREDGGQLLYEFGSVNTAGKAVACFAIEDGQVLVVGFGMGDQLPPPTHEGFASFAGQLGSPLLDRIVDCREPDSPLYRYARLSNRRRSYHRMRRWPQRFLVVGDAQCVFNPVHGQGMTVAALQAESLRAAAGRLLQAPGRTRAVQRRIASRATLPWLLATGNDARWTENPPRSSRATGWLMGRMLDRLTISPHLHLAFIRTQHLVAPTALLHPRALAALLLPARGTAATRHDTSPPVPTVSEAVSEPVPEPVSEAVTE